MVNASMGESNAPVAPYQRPAPSAPVMIPRRQHFNNYPVMNHQFYWQQQHHRPPIYGSDSRVNPHIGQGCSDSPTYVDYWHYDRPVYCDSCSSTPSSAASFNLPSQFLNAQSGSVEESALIDLSESRPSYGSHDFDDTYCVDGPCQETFSNEVQEGSSHGTSREIHVVEHNDIACDPTSEVSTGQNESLGRGKMANGGMEKKCTTHRSGSSFSRGLCVSERHLNAPRLDIKKSSWSKKFMRLVYPTYRVIYELENGL